MEKFIYNSFLAKSFADMPDVTNKEVVIIIINAHRPTISILDANGLNDIEKEALVNEYLHDCTSGCNYTYDIIQRNGNTFFCN